MLRGFGLLLAPLFFTVGFVGPVSAQETSSADTVETWHEDAWTPIVERNGVEVSYIFYPEANNENNGVVLRLHNQNNFSVRYAFTVIFRAPEAERSRSVNGHLSPGEMKTGDAAGLFWVPFREEDHTIGEVGLRGLEITPTGWRGEVDQQ